MECEVVECKLEAVHTVFWPGKTIRQCAGCTEQTKNIGKAMGFSVESVPLEIDDD